MQKMEIDVLLNDQWVERKSHLVTVWPLKDSMATPIKDEQMAF